MYAVVVRTAIHEADEGLKFLREQVVPAVSQAPGFVAGHWVRLAENTGTSLLVFDSEEAARAMTERIVPPPSGVVTPERVEVGEVVAHAVAHA